MTRKLLSAAASLALLALAAGPALAQATGDLTVNVRGMRAGQGAVLLALYPSSDTYTGNQPSQQAKVDSTNNSGSATFSGLAPGRYAMRAIYDLNNNGRYDQGEPVFYSNRTSVDEDGHEPLFSDASFEVHAGANSQVITVTLRR